MKYAGKKPTMMPSSQPSAQPVQQSAPSTTTVKTGSFNGKSNTAGGGGRAAQLKAKGMSGGLIGYLGRKKFGNKAMGQMSATGKARNSA